MADHDPDRLVCQSRRLHKRGFQTLQFRQANDQHVEAYEQGRPTLLIRAGVNPQQSRVHVVEDTAAQVDEGLGPGAPEGRRDTESVEGG